MSDQQPVGTCSACGHHFPYALVHSGFGDLAYAYCNRCGRTALLSGWAPDIPPEAGLRIHARIGAAVEPFLAPCECGGHFTAAAVPRCPHCREELSAEAVRGFIEANAPGTAQGWRWQGSWGALYCMVIDGRVANDPWKHRASVVPPEA